MKINNVFLILVLSLIAGKITATENSLVKKNKEAFAQAWAFKMLPTHYDNVMQDIGPHMCINEGGEFNHPHENVIKTVTSAVTDYKKKFILTMIKWGTACCTAGIYAYLAKDGNVPSPTTIAYSALGAASLMTACHLKEQSLEKNIETTMQSNSQYLNQQFDVIRNILKTYGWRNLVRTEHILAYAFQNINYTPQSNSHDIIGMHGLGDTAANFKPFCTQMFPHFNAYCFDFHDDAAKPVSIGANLELITAAYHASYFQYQHKKQNSQSQSYMCGFSRGGGVGARLMSHVKDTHEFNGYILLAPCLNISQSIQHIIKTTCKIYIPEFFINSSIYSTNIASAPISDLHPKTPVVVKGSPCLIIQGEKDPLINHMASQAWAEQHQKMGNDAYYLSIPQGNHTNILNKPVTKEAIAIFLKICNKQPLDQHELEIAKGMKPNIESASHATDENETF